MLISLNTTSIWKRCMSKQGCLENSAGSLLEVDYVSMLYSKNDQITGHKIYDRHLNWTEVFQFHNPQCSKGTLACLWKSLPIRFWKGLPSCFTFPLLRANCLCNTKKDPITNCNTTSFQFWSSLKTFGWVRFLLVGIKQCASLMRHKAVKWIWRNCEVRTNTFSCISISYDIFHTS